MKYLVALVLTIIVGFALSLYLPWYAIAIAAFVVALVVEQTSFKAFLSGFVGVFILWATVSLWINGRNEHLLSNKIANLFPLQGESYLLLLIGALIGGLVGGLSALSGSQLKKLLNK